MPKNEKQECPRCKKLRVTLYRPHMKHPGPNLCYWCNEKRVKEENAVSKG